MKIVILDAKTLGDDIEFSVFNKLGDVSVYQTTSSLQLKDRIKSAAAYKYMTDKVNFHNISRTRNAHRCTACYNNKVAVFDKTCLLSTFNRMVKSSSVFFLVSLIIGITPHERLS